MRRVGLDTEMMTNTFADALAEHGGGVFDPIVFAITDWWVEQRFIGPFQRMFSGAHEPARDKTTDWFKDLTGFEESTYWTVNCVGLDVRLVSYGAPEPAVVRLMADFA